MRGWSWLMVLASAVVFGAAVYGAAVYAAAEDGLADDGPAMHFPQVAGYGGVVHIADAAEPPRRGTKIIFDITADSKPEDFNKGLESVARYLNLNADAGFATADVRLALVLHGAATKGALDDAAYAKLTGVQTNPSRELIHELKACGVEVFVCGQSLARHSFAAADVNRDVTVAASAMTVNANKQQDGYSYLSIH